MAMGFNTCLLCMHATIYFISTLSKRRKRNQLINTTNTSFLSRRKEGGSARSLIDID